MAGCDDPVAVEQGHAEQPDDQQRTSRRPRARPRPTTSSVSARMPPSPRLSARRMNTMYLIDTTRMSDQRISEHAPMTLPGVDRDAVALEGLAEGVQRTRTDVAEHDAERADREQGQSRARPSVAFGPFADSSGPATAPDGSRPPRPPSSTWAPATGSVTHDAVHPCEGPQHHLVGSPTDRPQAGVAVEACRPVLLHVAHAPVVLHGDVGHPPAEARRRELRDRGMTGDVLAPVGLRPRPPSCGAGSDRVRPRCRPARTGACWFASSGAPKACRSRR